MLTTCKILICLLIFNLFVDNMNKNDNDQNGNLLNKIKLRDKSKTRQKK